MSTQFRCEYPIEVLRRAVQTNDFGDEIEVSGEPETVLVFGWYVGNGLEGRADGHVYQVEWDATVYAPIEADIHAGDRIRLPRIGEFTIVGEPSQWEANPWWSPGLVAIHLKRVGDRDESQIQRQTREAT